MRQMVYGLGAIALATLTSACGGYTERTYAVAAPGATYYGDRYYDGYTYRRYPSTAYYTPSPYYYPSSYYTGSTTGYYYSNGDYYRNYRGIHSPDERTM